MVFYLVFVLFFSSLQSVVWDFKSNSSVFQFDGVGASLTLNTPITGFRGSLEMVNGCLPTFLTLTTTGDYIEATSGMMSFPAGSIKGGGKMLRDEFGTMQIVLSGNKTLSCSEVVGYPIFVEGVNNSIIGTPRFDSTITLSNSSSELSLGLTTALTKNIVVNGGTVKTICPLTLSEGVLLEGDGNVDLNNLTLYLADTSVASPWAGNLVFSNSGLIRLAKDNNVSGTWEFLGSSKTSILWGKNSHFRLGNQGTLKVGPNHKLRFDGIDICSLQDAICHFDIDVTSTIAFSGSVLSLGGDFTISNGTVLFEGLDSVLRASGTSSLIFTGTATKLVVDNATVVYDSRNNPGRLPVVLSSGAEVVYLNNGSLIPFLDSLRRPSVDMIGAVTSVHGDVALSDSRQMRFVNPTPESRTAMTFLAGGHIISSIGASTVFVVGENIDLVIKDVVIDGFDPAQFVLGGTGATKSTISFGDGAVLILSKGVDIDSSFPLNVVGSVLLDGHNYSLSLPEAGMLKVGDGGVLRLKDARVALKDENSLLLDHDNAVLEIYGSHVYLEVADSYFAKGSLDVCNVNSVLNFDSSNNSEPAHLIFSSKGSMTFKTESSLVCGVNTCLCYQPNTAGDGTNDEKKRHFVFTDTTSTLVLKSSILDTSPTGIIFDTGRLEIRGDCLIKIPDTVDGALDLYDTMIVDILEGASFSLDGPTNYL